MSADASSSKETTGSPQGTAPDPQATLAELKKRNIELQSSLKVLQLRQASSAPEQLQELRRQEEELREMAGRLLRLYLPVLLRQDEHIRRSAQGDVSDAVFKSAAVKYLAEQKVPNDLWKSLEY